MPNPIPPGGIVSVPDAGGGAGAAVLTSQIVNATWQNGQTRTLDAENRIDNAMLAAASAPLVLTPVLDTSYVPPISPTLNPTDPLDGQSIYNNTRAEIEEMMTTAFATFQLTYFPDIQPATNAALQWLLDALETGGTGVNAVVEAQVWERDRARFLSETDRAEKEAFSAWANRGFPLPPGALAHQIMTINKGATDQLATQSRDIAIKTLEIAVENARLAVSKALELRIAALQAGLEYIKALILGPQTAMQLATGLVNLRIDFNRSLVALYQAQSVAIEPRVRLAIADADLKMRGAENNQRSELALITQRCALAIEAARQVATQAAALLNGINAGVSISGNDSGAGPNG